MLGANTMPPSQVQGALPAEPTGMIQTPVDPTLTPQLRYPPTGSFTNITPQQRQQILQRLQGQPTQQVDASTNGNLLGTQSSNAANAVNLMPTQQPTQSQNLLGTPAAQNTS